MSGIRGHAGLMLSQVAQSDPKFSLVKALLNMGGAAGSTAFPDSTGLRSWTRNGNVAVSRALGPNTAIFDGSGDSLTTAYVQSDFDWWTNDFTLEAWIYASSFTGWYSTTVPVMIGNASVSTPTNYWSFGPVSGGVLTFYYYNGTGVLVSGGTVPTGKLAHIAVSKDSSGIYLAVDGVVSGPTAISGTPQSGTSSGAVLTLGQINNTSIPGHVQALRITKGSGAARYTSAYTPPPAPFPTS